MKKQTIQLLFFSIIIIFLAMLTYCSKKPMPNHQLIDKVFNTPDIISLFAITADDIKKNTPLYSNELKKIIDSIVAIPDDQRTFANTIKPLDDVCELSNIAIAQSIYHSLELLSPDEKIRNAAHDACITIGNVFVDQILNNKALYDAFIAYAGKNEEFEQLSDQQRYFINDTISSFRRAGLSLPAETLALVNALRKELAILTLDFARNIAEDKSSISVTQQELAGLDDDFVNALTHTDDGLYTLGIDYPTYSRVMENCSVTETRKKLYIAFNNRAYPANDELLKLIIEKRDEMAKLLGYSDFAHCDIDDQMAHTPERAQTFITDIVQKSLAKVAVEMATLTRELPESVKLTKSGQIEPWSFAYLTSNYKKTHFNIDEQKIAEYFPIKKTVEELLDIYRQFFSINFQEVPSSGLWHEDVTVIRVTNKAGNQLLGTLMLDLYPRPNKYNHAGEITILPGTYKTDGSLIPNISIVVANFAKPTATQSSFAEATADRPSLLKRSEVQTFFHEFGHALHAILGATHIASLSGTRTKTDFVELPSQMLEEWLTNKDILKKVSGHYLSGEPLSDDVIDTIIKLKNLTSGCSINQQAYFAQMSLSFFSLGAHKNPHAIMQDLHTTIMPHIAWDENNHLYASFGHLTGYGAKYYGYLWSKVFALDLFATIKQHGLLNPEIGQKYVKEVLSKGGAQDPNELLYNFLGREPNAQAFLQDMGLK